MKEGPLWIILSNPEFYLDFLIRSKNENPHSRLDVVIRRFPLPEDGMRLDTTTYKIHCSTVYKVLSLQCYTIKSG